jgi:transposase
MTQHSHITASHQLDYDRTLILAVEVSGRSWIVAAQVPGLRQKGVKQQLAPRADALMAAIEGYKRRAAAAGMAVDRVIVAYESGGSGFWLARWLQQRGVEVYVMQPSSVPVDRRMRRAKSDRIDADMLLRTLLAWLRGEPRVCSMVPVPDEATEDARRPMREREELIRARVAIVNRIEAVLTVLGAGEYNPLRRDCRERLDQLRTALDQPLPPHARAQIERLLDRLDLVC